jgi:Ribbon-helix-helix protein, copG family
MTVSLRTDPGQQLITFYLPRHEADRLLLQANSLGWSRAELLRRLIKTYLGEPRQAETNG